MGKYFIMAWIAGLSYWLAYVFEQTFSTKEIIFKIIVLFAIPILLAYGTITLKKASGFIKSGKQLFFLVAGLILTFSILFWGVSDIFRHYGTDRLSEALFVLAEVVFAFYFLYGGLRGTESPPGPSGPVPTGVIRSADSPERHKPSQAPTPPQV